MKAHAYAPGPEVASYLSDIEEELPSARFDAYLNEVYAFVPSDVDQILQEVRKHLEEAKANLRKAAGELRRRGI